MFNDLNIDQARQSVDLGQIFDAYREARSDLDRRFAGSMSWKTVRGRDYLYRRQRGASRSLGPRGEATEAAYRQFHEGRDRVRERLTALAARLDRMAPVNRALRLGRVPLIAARVLRALAEAGLADGTVTVVGTNALFAYEALAGVQIESAYLATGDIDLLYDARRRLKLLAPDIAVSGVLGLLRKLDHSFEVRGRPGFRAENRDGYIVDLIAPAKKDPMAPSDRSRIGSDQGDLQAIEIEGLSWLVNSPKATATVVDERGYPLAIRVPDPRAFALHKSWLAERPDRQPVKRVRDAAQADLVARLVGTRLPHLRFDDPALSALPLALRDRALALALPDAAVGPSLKPDW